MKQKVTLALTFACSIAVSCATAPSPVAVPLTAPEPHENLNAVVWTQTAVEFDALAHQAYNLARMQLDRALADRSWTAAPDEQRGDFASLPPAVILDVDETVLDNSPHQAQLTWEHADFNQPQWKEWVDMRAASAIPGALEFTRYAASKGVSVFYVTNRLQVEKAATVDNLRKLGFPIDDSIDAVRVVPETDPKDSAASAAAREKANRRRDIAAKWRIVLLVGDDLGDFIAGAKSGVEERERLVAGKEDLWGSRWIILPNPQYGSWERALTHGMRSPGRDEVLRRKFEIMRRTGKP